MIDLSSIFKKIANVLKGRSVDTKTTKESKPMKYGTGYIKSKLDGTEKEYVGSDKFKVPEKFSYVSFLPPITDQGSSSKCVAHSLTAYMDWKKNLGEGDNNGGQFSIDKLYSIREDKHADGMQIKEALVYLYKTGMNGFKISGYAKVGSAEYLKQAIIANGPCVAALPVYEDHMMKDFWNGSSYKGGHAILVVGFNKNGFIIRNSWGRGFGNKGYIVLPYDSFNKFYEIWTMY